MKKQMVLPAILLLSSIVFGQAPQGIPYQAVVRNSSGQIVGNSLVGFQFIIHDSTATGTIRYVQQDTVHTDQFGLITVVIGGGIAIQGNFDSIKWALGAKFLEVGLDPAGGTNYTDMGTTQFMSVPYALFAGSAPYQPSACDSLWVINGNNISNSNTGNLGIQTDTPSATLTVNGFTMMGIDAPPIKVRELTGTTPATAGDSVVIATGIADSSVRDVQVLVHDPVNGLLSPVLNLLNVQYSYTYLNSVFTLKTSLLNSLGILNKPFTVLITYRQ